MKPFLLLASRAEDVAAEGEYEAFLRFAGWTATSCSGSGWSARPLPVRDLDDYAGVMVGGSPFNSSDPPSEVRRPAPRGARAAGLLDRIVARDFPFLGACYGVGTLGVHQGGIDRPHLRRAAAA